VVHSLQRSLFLPRPRQEVFPFFAEVANLQRITPASLGFEFLTPLPVEMRAGARIEYRIRLLGMPVYWTTRITAWDPPHSFQDEQLRGPYKEWVHTHTFEAVDGGTMMRDSIRYRLPLWPLGVLALPLVRLQLGAIFRYREQAIGRILLGA
jgi:ligand-binding SRPBCC domain-containing protein